MAYRYRFSKILQDLADNPQVPTEYRNRLKTLWLLDLAGNDEEFSEDEKEFLLDLANDYILLPAKTRIDIWAQSKSYCSGLPIKVKPRRY